MFDRIFEALSDDADFEYVIVDGTIVRVHQHGTDGAGLAGRPRRLPLGDEADDLRDDEVEYELEGAVGALVRRWWRERAGG